MSLRGLRICFPNYKILEWSKLKSFTDDISSNDHFYPFDWIENTSIPQSAKGNMTVSIFCLSAEDSLRKAIWHFLYSIYLLQTVCKRSNMTVPLFYLSVANSLQMEYDSSFILYFCCRQSAKGNMTVPLFCLSVVDSQRKEIWQFLYYVYPLQTVCKR